MPGWGFFHCSSHRAHPALPGSGHRPDGDSGPAMASQDFSFLESSLQGTPGPSLVLPRGAAAANTTLPSSRGPSTCSCTPISSSCGPPPAVALPLLKLPSAALLTPDCRVPPPVSESAGLGEDPKCCLTMNHTLSSTGHHAGGSPGELAKSCSRLGPRHSGPFNLDGPGNRKLKQAPSPAITPSNSVLHTLGNTPSRCWHTV